MALKPLTLNNFKWWLNLSTISDIEDNQFQVAKNVFYNSNGNLQTRYGTSAFGGPVGSNKPVTSLFSFQRDDTGVVTLLASSGTDMYKLDNTLLTWASIKSWLTEFETATGKTTRRTRWDFAVYKNVIYLTNGVNAYASYDWTTYTEYAGQPKFRYINMNLDILYGSWDDGNPSSIYYTAAAPVDWSALNTNIVVVGWDEMWRINGMTEFGQVMLAMKDSKIYTIDITNTKALPIDAQTGWFSDRSIATVWNSIVYLTERGVDTLKPRDALSGTSALDSLSLDENVRELTTKIDELNLNANCWWYIKRANNYYFSFDSNGDDIPDTTLVYNSLVKAWTQYTYPSLYDYCMYIDSTWAHRYLLASAINDQLIEIETWFQDLGVDIENEIKSKAFDFWEPWTFKTFWYVDIIWQKSKYKDIQVNIEVDWVIVGWWLITDDMIIQSKPKETLGTSVIWVNSLTWSTDVDSWLDVYQFVARIPLYVTGSTISFSMKSTGWTWILHKARIDVNAESIDVFGYNNIV